MKTRRTNARRTPALLEAGVAALALALLAALAPSAAVQDPEQEDAVAVGTPDVATLKRLQDLASRQGAVDLLVRMVGEDVRGIPVPTLDQAQQARLQLARERLVREAGLPQAVLSRGGQRQAGTLPLVFLELLPGELDRLVSRAGPPAAAPLGAPQFRVQRMPELRQQRAPRMGLGHLSFDQVLEDLEVAPALGELSGAGQTIVVVDTGVQHDLPDIASKLVASYHPGTQEPLMRVADEGAAPAERCVDRLCHGSQVAWIGAQIAPGSRLVCARVDELNSIGADPGAPLDNIVLALEDVLETWSAAPVGARVVNLSLSLPAREDLAGSGSWCSSAPGAPVHMEAVGVLIDALRSRGVAVVVAAGNDDLPHALPAGGGPAPPAALGFPACLESAVSVVGTRPENGYSGGPSTRFERRFHPSNWAAHADLAAPAAFFTAKVRTPSGGTWELSLGPGTSVSAPFVAGAIALLLEGGHETHDVVDRLKSTGRPIPDPPPESGRTAVEVPQIRVLTALRALEGVSGPADASSPTGGGTGGH